MTGRNMDGRFAERNRKAVGSQRVTVDLVAMTLVTMGLPGVNARNLAYQTGG